MKYKIFVLTAFLVSFMSFGQIGGAEEVPSWETVGVANKLVGYPKLEKTKVGDKEYYGITYQNLEYTAITDIKTLFFYATPSEIEYLYDALQKGGHKNESTSIDVGEGRISVKKVANSIRFNMYHPLGETDGWFWITPKQLGNMFGVKYDKKKYKG
jgi:hypothetical protein